MYFYVLFNLMHFKPKIFNVLLLVALLAMLAISSCKKDEAQAEESLIGEWNVTEINSYYGKFSETGQNIFDDKFEKGQFGTFLFKEDVVDYSFTRNDTLYSGSDNWILSFEKVNSGFTQVNRFKLVIGNTFYFDLAFEDQTSNAEKDATYVTLTETPTEGNRVMIMLRLDKK